MQNDRTPEQEARLKRIMEAIRSDLEEQEDPVAVVWLGKGKGLREMHYSEMSPEMLAEVILPVGRTPKGCRARVIELHRNRYEYFLRKFHGPK